MSLLVTTLKGIQFGTGLTLEQRNAEGFSLQRRTELFYFTEGVGNTVSNQIPSGPPGSLQVGSVPGSFTWLPGGGIELVKNAHMLVRPLDISAKWAMTASLQVETPVTVPSGGSGTNIGAIMGFELYPPRGIVSYYVVDAPYTPPGAGFFVLRTSKDGAAGGLANTFLADDPGITKIQQRYLYVMQHDGLGSIQAAFYDKNGIIKGSIAGKVAISDFTTIAGVPVTQQRPSIGILSNGFPDGKIRVEHFGVFVARNLVIEDIKQECFAANALATARGRPLS